VHSPGGKAVPIGVGVKLPRGLDLSQTTATFSSAATLVDLLLDVPLLALRDGFVDDALSFVLGEFGVF